MSKHWKASTLGRETPLECNRDTITIERKRRGVDEVFAIVLGEDKTAEKDARLIAAAPEMLKALELCAVTLRDVEPGTTDTDLAQLRDTLQALIAKARGDS